MIKKFLAKPVTVRAIRWDGKNLDEIINFTNGLAHLSKGKLAVETMEGTSWALEGDWIVNGTHGEFYPVKPAVMETKYDEVE